MRVIALVCFFYAFAAHGQSEQISLDAAIQEALQNNPGLRAIQAEIDVARTESKAVSSFQEQPALSISVESTASNFERVELGVVQALPIKSRLALAKNLGDARVSTLEELFKATQVSISAKVARAYVACWIAGEEVKLAKEREALARASREATAKRSASGDTSTLELLLIQAEEERTKAVVALAEGKFSQTRVELTIMLGRKPSMLVTPTEPKISAVLRSIDELLASLEDSPQLTAASNDISASQAALALARKSLVSAPSLRFGGAFQQLQIDSADFLGDPGSITGVKNAEGQIFFELEAPIPLLKKGFRASVQGAVSQVLVAESKKEQLKRELTGQLLSARERLAAALAAEELLFAAVPHYEEATALAEKGYSSGLLSLDSLLLARGRMFDARQTLLSARAGTMDAAIDLQEALGKTKP